MNGEGGVRGHCGETHPLNLTGDGIFIWLVSLRWIRLGFLTIGRNMVVHYDQAFRRS